jgi:hypothetical protein
MDKSWLVPPTSHIARTRMMRAALTTLVVILITCASSLMMMTDKARAVGTDHPFCMQGRDYPALSACNFDSYAACEAIAFEFRSICIPNPYFVGETDDPYYVNPYFPKPAKPRRVKSPRHHHQSS